MNLFRPGFLALCLILAGSRLANGQPMLALRVATPPIDTGAQVFYAEELGMFKRAGLDVQIETVGSGPSLAAAIAGGSFDIGQSNVPSLAAARERGLPFVVIAPASIYTNRARPTAGIVVGKNTTIRTARDFNGKTMAVTALLNIGQVTTEQWIDKNGGDSSTVKFIEMPYAAMTAALTAGRVDAGEFAYPQLDEALQAGHRLLGTGDEAVAPSFVIGAWFTTIDFAKTHPDAVRRFVGVMAQAARWANTHRPESAQILEKWTKQQVVPTMPRVYYGERVSIAQIQPIIDVAFKYHALNKPLSAVELIAPEVLHAQR